MYVLEVFDPSGATERTSLHAPRLGSLENRTICELSNGSWQAHRTFPLVRELLSKRFPTLNILPYTDFPIGSSGPDSIDTDKAVDLLVKKGCQGVIVGNAG